MSYYKTEPDALAAGSAGSIEIPADFDMPANAQENDEATRHAWKPVEPGALERALQKMSGWSKVFVPFLAQNIGWFISGFLFIAGSVFLVAYSEGFRGTLTIASVLFVYTVLLISGVSLLRQRRPELHMTAGVLTTVAMLLIPLTISASVRLIDMNSLTVSVTGILLTIANLIIFYWIAHFASRLLDQSLQGLYPRLFMAMAAVQAAAPLIGQYPAALPLLAFLHLTLLSLLGYGLVHFINGWLKSVFLDQRRLAYYTAGTLVYAALVSFIHLTWRYENPLPGGYYGPFLMILSGFLFFVDAGFKQWTRQYAFLSRFSFAVYGLSALALAICFNAPEFRLITLCLGAGVYAMVVRHYLTLAPLYMLLACLGWLYGLLILQHVHWSYYFLASVPGLSGLLAMQRWALKRKAGSLALLCFRVLAILATGLGVWSLIHTGPGVPGAMTCLLITGLIYSVLRYMSRDFLSGLGLKESVVSRILMHGHDLRNSSWFYAVSLSGVLTIAYAPVFVRATWTEQFATGLLLLAGLWTGLGAKLYQNITGKTAPGASVFFNSALLGILSALALIIMAKPSLQNTYLHVVLILSGGILAWQSIILRIRSLFYSALVSCAAGAAFIKQTYFPGPAPGLPEMLTLLAAWGLTWRLERIEKLKTETESHTPHFPLPTSHFSLLTSHFSLLSLLTSHSSLAETMRLPLQHTMAILWGWVMFCLGRYVTINDPNLVWVFSAGLGTLATMLLSAHFRSLRLWPLSVFLGLGTLTGLLFHLKITDPMTLSFAAVLYSTVVWLAARWAVARPVTLRLAGLLHLSGGHGTKGGRNLTEQKTYQAVCLTTLASMGTAVFYWQAVPHMSVLGTLLSGMLFLWLTGQIYQKRSHSYAVLAAAITTFFVIHVRILAVTDLNILSDDARTGLSLTVLSFGMWAMAWILDHMTDRNRAEEFSKSMYRRPLRVMAAWLALAAACQQMFIISDILYSPLCIPVLGLSGFCLLLGNYKLGNIPLNLAGILFVSLALLWTESVAFHGITSVTLWPDYDDQWLSLALLSLILASLATFADRFPRFRPLYAQPLRLVSVTAYGVATLKIALFFIAGLRGDMIPWLFLVQAVTLFPLLKSLPSAPAIRGVGALILLTGFAVSSLPMTGFLKWDIITQFIYAFALWGTANHVLPSFNRRQPRWAVSPEAWPWFGLMLVTVSQPFTNSSFFFRPEGVVFLEWSYWLALALYLFLLMRNSKWYGLFWLAPGALTIAGILSAGRFAEITNVRGPTPFVTETLIWASLIPFLVPLVRRYGSLLAGRQGWQISDPGRPFFVWPPVILGVLLILSVATDLNYFFPASLTDVSCEFLLLNSVLLAVCFIHLFRLRQNLLNAHCLLAALFNMMFTACLSFPSACSHLPLVLALWSGVLFGTHILWEHRGGKDTSALRQALSGWLMLSPWPALCTLLVIPLASLQEMVLTLTLLTGITGALGYRRRNHVYVFAAWLLGLILVHIWPVMFLPPAGSKGQVLLYVWPMLCAKFERLQVLFPWYALQMAILVWVIPGLRRWLPDRLPDYLKDKWHPLHSLFRNLPLMAALAFGEWITHVAVFFHRLPSMPLENARIHGIAALVTACLLIMLGIRRIIRTHRSRWVYGVALMTGLTGVYLRLLVVGLLSLTLWDTTVLMGAAYTLFMLQRFSISDKISVPLFRLTMLVPVLSILTVPLEWASAPAAAVMMAAGALYLSLRHTTGKSLPLYLGVLTVNAAIYLWIPSWFDQYNLMQFYIVPAALSVLVLLHLHRDEMNRGVLNNTRLAAVSVLYASATLDVFLGPESGLWTFCLALFLALSGVILGIGLRIRAFLYGGVIFLVMNVLGQLFCRYPEEGLNMGILLTVLGAVIMGGMIWFNIKQESILKHVRIFRADLECWA